MKHFLIFAMFFLFSCSANKSTFICGDHKCVNKAEAKKYFEENLTIEVQINTKGKESRFDLVKLNLSQEKKDIKVFKKKNKKELKKLSKKEIKAKKRELKKDKKKQSVLNNIKQKNEPKKAVTINKSANSIDICLEIEKCDINSITDYLLKKGNEKNFPNISVKE